MQILTGFIVIVALSWAMGRLIAPLAGVFLFVGLASVGFAVTRVGEFSVPFAFSAVGVVSLLLGVLQDVPPFASMIPGFTPTGFNWFHLAIGSIVASALVILVDIRVTSAFRRDSGRPQASNPDTVARAFQRRASRLFDDWRGVVAAAVFIGFLLLQAAFGLVGDVGGQVLAEIGQVPVVSGFAAFIPFVYANMGGNLPLLSGLPLFGTLTAGEVAIVGVLVLLLAYFSREGDS